MLPWLSDSLYGLPGPVVGSILLHDTTKDGFAVQMFVQFLFECPSYCHGQAVLLTTTKPNGMPEYNYLPLVDTSVQV